MSEGAVTGPVPVLVAASGADWEARALDVLERARPAMVLTRRCVDLTDLLATAATGLARVAVLSTGLPGLDADSVATLHRAGVAVLLVAAADELADGHGDRLRRLGVEEVLPVAEVADLPAAVTSVAAGPARAAAAAGEPPAEVSASGARGRVLAVWGPTGAPGRTTVAVGLAGELAAAGHDTFLVDADPYGGSVAQHLGVLDEASGLLGAARAANAGQLDAARLAATGREVSRCLRVLTGLPRPDRWQEVRPAAFADLLHLAAGMTDYLVLDLGFSLETDAADPFGGSMPQRNQMTLTGLERADAVVVVGSADPVGLARLARGLVDLRDLQPGVQPWVVVNRTRSTLGWSNRELTGMVEGFVRPQAVHFLPDDRPAVDRAIMSGTALAEGGDSPLRTALAELAGAVAGRPVQVAGGRFRRRRG